MGLGFGERVTGAFIDSNVGNFGYGPLPDSSGIFSVGANPLVAQEDDNREGAKSAKRIKNPSFLCDLRVFAANLVLVFAAEEGNWCGTPKMEWWNPRP
jgi:hypothetical protein